MLCQKCHKNEAEQYYMGNWNGNLFIVGFCSDCMNEMGNKAVSAGYENAVRQMIGWYPGKEAPRADGTVPFPEHADPELINRVHLNEMRIQLKEAADREDYQEAARLRDAIQKICQEESYYES